MPKPEPAATSLRRATMSGIDVILGTDQPRQRLTFRATDPKCGMEFRLRLKWLRAVEAIGRGYRRRKESFPHKLVPVATALALAGDEIWLDLDEIADRSGCCERTVRRILLWLEDHNALTWDWTTRFEDGHWVRSLNRYRLSREVIALIGTVAKRIRPERPIYRKRRQPDTESAVHPVRISEEEKLSLHKALLHNRKIIQARIDASYGSKSEQPSVDAAPTRRFTDAEQARLLEIIRQRRQT